MAVHNPLQNGTITIQPLNGRATKVVVHLNLNGGAATIQPRVKLAGTAALDGAPQQVEYNTAAARSTKLVANITTSGVYEFLIDCLDLVLTVSGVGGGPILGYETSNA